MTFKFKESKKAAVAFSLAVFDKRLTEKEVKDYIYVGHNFGKDIFINFLTGEFLD